MIKILFAALLLFVVNLNAETKAEGASTLIKYDYTPGEIPELTRQAIKKMDKDIETILKVPEDKKSFENTIAALDKASIELDDTASQLSFMFYVSTNPALRKEGVESEQAISEYSVKLFTRRDLYNAVLAASKNPSSKKLGPVEKRLLDQTLRGFKRNGLALSDDKLEEVKKLKIELSKLTTDFQSNINEDKTIVEFTPAEVDGAPADFIKRFEKDRAPNGNYKIRITGPNYTTFMENVHSSEARKRMALAYERRAPQNIEVLNKVLALRQKIAPLLGYRTWADYAIEERMAKNSKTATDFLQGLKTKVAQRNKDDLAILLKFKKTLDPKAKKLEAWDGRYLENQMKKKYFADDEVMKEYFPADHVVQKMFEIYSTLLGVKFVQVKGAAVWSPDVQMYEVRNSKDNSFVANFYTDFIPREGKYTHAAAFGLVTGRESGGSYIHPVASIVANFDPPSEGKPSLFTFDQVETLFHEFGHIMHQVLTKAKFGSQAGTRVARDFVEAPSQMLENWVWSPEMIKNISGYYKDPTKKMPDELIKKLMASRDFNQGYFYSRQLLFGIFDMTLHSSTKPQDPVALYKKLYKEIAHVEPLDETLFPASFGHLMGYDAGYYGYLWSKVYSDDMFSLFDKEGLLNTKLGSKYRKVILEKGDSAESSTLLKEFLGRPASNRAFLKKLLVNGSTAALPKSVTLK